MDKDGLSLPQDEAFQRRDWRAQRAGAWAFGVVLLAAASGLFGDGPLGRVRAEGDAIQVEYDRFLRRTARSELVLTLVGGAPGDAMTIELTGEYFTASEPARIRPLPLREVALPDGVRLEFEADGPEGVDIRIELRPTGSGWREGEVRVNGRAVRVSGFVYP